VLAIVVAAQFMFGVDAFIVNVAIPTIAAELHTSSAQIEAVIAIYLIAYATLVVTGGRLGDIYGTRAVFIAGILVTLDLAGLGWRVVFFVNVPFGLIIIAAAVKIMPTAPRRYAAGYSRRRRTVCGIAVPDRTAAVRPRSALVTVPCFRA
jgi:MFS family permease